MSSTTYIQKIYKTFNNFTEEEQWLQSLVQDGWILTKYNDEDMSDCLYIFEPIQHEEQTKRTYKIHYRTF